ncbi:MAG: hypothetical protein LBK70_00545 [Clostridiales bacterium]|jgi:hypothetical protein|nr:hypothetical protein [Clostridiales bacterium]
MNYKVIIIGSSLIISGCLLLGFGMMGAISMGGFPQQGLWYYEMLPGIFLILGACFVVMGLLMVWLDRVN